MSLNDIGKTALIHVDCIVLSNRIAFRSVQLHACSVRFSIMKVKLIKSLRRHDSLLFYCCISCNIMVDIP